MGAKKLYHLFMNENALNPKKTDKKKFEVAATGYLLKYIKELQTHFNLSDCDIKKIIARVNSAIKCQSSFDSAFNNFLGMLKSCLREKKAHDFKNDRSRGRF